MDTYGIAAFRSRQQVLKYERIFLNNGIKARVVSTPREIAVGCGLSLQFPVDDLKSVQAIIQKDRPANLIGLYLVDQRGGGRSRLTVVSK